MNVLVTGGVGYIGSHTVVELINAGYSPIVVDDLSNSSRVALDRIGKITGVRVPLYIENVADKDAIRKIFSDNDIEAVIHFAGFKAVGESVEKPVEYYRNNIDSTLCLVEVMAEFGVKKLIFSSSATVYGSADIPYIETQTTGVGITNPYGRTKHMIESILSDVVNSNDDYDITSLRYFNPIGAHESGLIGEDPQGVPNNLMPFISQVANGLRDELSIFGDDYDTPDGTCRRDYIHVVDLAKGHVKALEKSETGFDAINLGSGKPTSVLELVHAFEQTTGQKVPYKIAERRAGDLPEFYANSEKALRLLDWKTEKSIEDMCKDTWRWQSQNPNGYNN